MLFSSHAKYTHLPPPGRLPAHGGRYIVEQCKKELETWAARAAYVEQACAHLIAWRESLQFVRLFEKFFPQEYSEAAREPQSWRLHPQSRIAPIEEQFFDLIESRLFPFGRDWMEMTLEEIRHGHDFLPVIPFISVTPPPDEWDTSSEEYVVIRVLHCFSWDNYFAPDEEQWYGLVVEFANRGVTLPKPMLYPWHGAPQQVNLGFRLQRILMHLHLKNFLAMARAAGYPWLGTTLDVLYRDTNNLLVDIDEEMNYEMFEWTEENLKWLADEWSQGSRLLDTFWQAIQMLQKQPAICAHLIELWNASWSCAREQLWEPQYG